MAPRSSRSRSPARGASPKRGAVKASPAAGKKKKTRTAKKDTGADAESHAFFAYDGVVRSYIMPLYLLVSSPLFAVSLTAVCIDRYGGSLANLWRAAGVPGEGFGLIQGLFQAEQGVLGAVWSVLRTVVADLPKPSWECLWIAFGWFLFQTFLLRFLDGPKSLGPPTLGGYQPEYRLNGVLAYVLTQALVVFAWWQGLFSAAHVASLHGEMMATLSSVSLLILLALLVKGKYAPTHRDADSEFSTNWIWNLFWGVELYPAALGLQLKQIVNCRMSMNAWVTLPVIFALAQAEIYGEIGLNLVVSTALLAVYIFKFFLWEDGYFNSIDIIHDRFGFVICWGCLVWVPSVYTSFCYYMLHHRSLGATLSLTDWGSPNQVLNNPALKGMQRPDFQAGAATLEYYSPFVALLNFAAGVFCILVNYWCDHQRQEFRNTGRVFGIKKPKFVIASYALDDGVKRRNKMLVSGWWGVARHINYVWELLAAFLWCAPAGFDNLVIPFFYFIFLFILLVDRQRRDEVRMRKKYGSDWNKVCKRVPYALLPGIY